jgi:hypothetical protein
VLSTLRVLSVSLRSTPSPAGPIQPVRRRNSANTPPQTVSMNKNIFACDLAS